MVKMCEMGHFEIERGDYQLLRWANNHTSGLSLENQDIQLLMHD